MKITKIENQKKHKNRKSVFIDERFAFGIDEFSLFKLKLKENDEISRERLDFVLETVIFEDAKNYALNLLSRKAYTEKNMLLKLNSRTENEEVSNAVLEFLKEMRYIDDENYAYSYAANCLNIKKYGRKKIKYKLLEKGISPALAQKVVDELGDDSAQTESENLYCLAQKKLADNFDIKNIMKTKRFLAARGYNFGEIDTVIRKIKDEVGEDVWQENLPE